MRFSNMMLFFFYTDGKLSRWIALSLPHLSPSPTSLPLPPISLSVWYSARHPHPVTPSKVKVAKYEQLQLHPSVTWKFDLIGQEKYL